MDKPFRIEPRKIEFTTYGPAWAPVWAVTFALHASTGYEHQCTVIVPGQGHDDVADICAKARVELFRVAGLIVAGDQPQLSEPEEPLVPKPSMRSPKRRSRQGG